MFGKRKQRGAPVPATSAWTTDAPTQTPAPVADGQAFGADPREAALTALAAGQVEQAGSSTDRAGGGPAQASPGDSVADTSAGTGGFARHDPETPRSDGAGGVDADGGRAFTAAGPREIDADAVAGGATRTASTARPGHDEARAATWAATWGIPAETSLPVVEDPSVVPDPARVDTSSQAERPAPGSVGRRDEDRHDEAEAESITDVDVPHTTPVPRETHLQDDARDEHEPPNERETLHVTTGPTWAEDDAAAPLDLDSDERRRAALVQSLPTASPDTPLMAELQQDARRRIELRGRRFPRPAETRIVTVANQKGGVGKTTTTVNLAAALAQSGLNVLVLDNDPQGNASTALGIEHRAGTPSIYEVLVEGAPIAEAVQESPDVPNLWCLPATIDLSGAEIELVSMVARETRLRSALDTYLQWRLDQGMERIDYVFVDCPPSLGLLTVNAFVVAREVLIPIQCEYYALEGLSQLLKTIQLIQAHLNPDLHVSTILLTMYDARTNLAQQVASEVREHFPDRTLRTTVPRSVRISEAPSYGQTVMTYDAGSSGALAYLEAAREIAERGADDSAPDGTTTSTSTPAESGAEEDR